MKKAALLLLLAFWHFVYRYVMQLRLAVVFFALSAPLVMAQATNVYVTASGTATGNILTTGTWTSGIGGYAAASLAGDIEDVRTYNIALTGTQMSTLYANGPQH